MLNPLALPSQPKYLPTFFGIYPFKNAFLPNVYKNSTGGGGEGKAIKGFAIKRGQPAGSPIYEHMAAAAMAVCFCCCCCFCREEPFDQAESRGGGGGRPTNAIRPNMCVCVCVLCSLSHL